MRKPGEEQGRCDLSLAQARAVVRAVAEVVDDPGWTVGAAVRRCRHGHLRVGPDSCIRADREDVLDPVMVGLDPHDADPEVAGGVADQVVARDRVPAGWGSIAIRCPRGAHGNPAATRARPILVLGVLPLADDLDQQRPGVAHEVGGRRGPEQLAAVEDDDVVADPLEFTQQVGGHQDGDAEVVADPAYQCQHVVAGGGIEPVGRLVEQHQPWVVDQGLGQLGALLHAGRVAAHRAVALLGEADMAEHVGGALAGCRAGQAGHLGQVDDEVAGADVRRQAVVLGHVADRARICGTLGASGRGRAPWPTRRWAPAGRAGS